MNAVINTTLVRNAQMTIKVVNIVHPTRNMPRALLSICGSPSKACKMPEAGNDMKPNDIQNPPANIECLNKLTTASVYRRSNKLTVRCKHCGGKCISVIHFPHCGKNLYDPSIEQCKTHSNVIAINSPYTIDIY